MSTPWRTISVALRADGSAYAATLGQASAQTKAFGNEVDRSTKSSASKWTTMSKGFAVGGALLAAGFVAAVSTTAKFEARLSAVQAVSNATAGEMDLLRDKALQLGADTAFSASESASAMEELVKAGLSVEDVLNGAADATVALAAAGGVELTTAAEIAANAMNVFALSAEDMPKIADLVAGAANASAIDVADFAMSLQQSGAVANLVGLDFEDLALAITAMGNAGIKGSDAGTSLKTFFMRLEPSTQKSTDMMEKLGIITEDTGNQFFDAAGNAKDMADISDVLATALAGQTREQKLATLNTLFGADAIRAAAIIADEGAAGFDKLSESLGSISAAEIAEIRLDNLAGDIEKLSGSFETLLIANGSIFTESLRNLTQGATRLVDALASINGDDVADFMAPAAKYGRVLVDAWDDLASAGADVVDILGEMIDAGRPVVTVMAALGAEAIVGGIRTVASVLESLTGFLADNEGLVRGLTTALIALAAVKVYNALADGFSRAALAAYDLAGAVDKSTTVQNLGKISSGFSDVARNALAVPDATNRMSTGVAGGIGKIKEGFRGLTASLNSPTLAVAGIAIAITTITQGLSNAHAEADKLIDSLKPRGYDDRRTEDINKYAVAIERAAFAANEADGATGDWKKTIGGAVELLTPLENEILDQAIASNDAAAAAEVLGGAYDFLLGKYRDVATEINGGDLLGDMDWRTVESWAIKLDLDPDTQSVEEMAGAIAEASAAAENGTPVTDALAGAFGTFADETSNATDKLKAYKTLVDSLLGVQLSVFDATTAYGGALDELDDTLRENMWGGIGTDTAAGRANRDALSGAVNDALALAEAFAAAGDNDKAAFTIATTRAELIKAGQAAGIAEADMNAYLDTLGLTPSTLETLIQAQIDQGKLAEAENAVGWLTRPRSIFIDTVIGGVAGNVWRDAWNGMWGGGGDGEPRANGGPVRAGRPYVVGERRPELFVPKSSGWILPSVPKGLDGGGAGIDYAKLAQAMSGMAGPRVTVHAPVDARGTDVAGAATIVSRRIGWALADLG